MKTGPVTFPGTSPWRWNASLTPGARPSRVSSPNAVPLHGRSGGIRTPNMRFWRPPLFHWSYRPVDLLNPGADSGARTRGLLLGKQTLYLLSYARVFRDRNGRRWLPTPAPPFGAGPVVPDAPDDWSGQPGSNRRPPPWQGGALPAELCPQMVGGGPGGSPGPADRWQSRLVKERPGNGVTGDRAGQQKTPVDLSSLTGVLDSVGRLFPVQPPVV